MWLHLRGLRRARNGRSTCGQLGATAGDGTGADGGSGRRLDQVEVGKLDVGHGTGVAGVLVRFGFGVSLEVALGGEPFFGAQGAGEPSVGFGSPFFPFP